MVLVAAMHITSGVFINDAEQGLHRDIEEWLLKLIPEGHDYYHHRTGEVNGDAHLRNLLIGHQVIVPVTEGSLTWVPGKRYFMLSLTGSAAKGLLLKLWENKASYS